MAPASGFPRSSPWNAGTGRAPAKVPWGLTYGAELLEGWELLWLHTVIEQVLLHLCPPALQQLE